MKYFKLQEIIDKETYETEGQNAWLHFSTDALIMLDDLREFFGVPITVNNWHTGGTFQFRGYRPPSYPKSLSPLGSAHRYGMAFDCDIKGFSAERARTEILENKDSPLLANITRLEGDKNWVHLDMMKVVANERIYVFSA
jgi:hypothetical protein